jgi:UDP-glucose 4-epimerase
LHLAVVALSMGRIFHFLNTMNAGYLTSAIDAPSRNATANRYVVSKTAQTSSREHKTSVSESSKNLVPSNYGTSKTIVETVPMEESTDWKRQTQGRDEDEQIQVTREYAVTYETKGTAL